MRELKAGAAYNAITEQEDVMTKAMLLKLRGDIRKAGYQYASHLYSEGVEWILEDTTPTKADVYENFEESACHEGLQTDVWEAFESKGAEYIGCLKMFEWDEIYELFVAGGYRRINEILRDT